YIHNNSPDPVISNQVLESSQSSSSSGSTSQPSGFGLDNRFLSSDSIPSFQSLPLDSASSDLFDPTLELPDLDLSFEGTSIFSPPSASLFPDLESTPASSSSSLQPQT